MAEEIELYASWGVTVTDGSFTISVPAQTQGFLLEDADGGTVLNPFGPDVPDDGLTLDGIDPDTGLPLDATQEGTEAGGGGGFLPAIQKTLAISRALILQDPVTGGTVTAYEVVEVQVWTDWEGNIQGVEHWPQGWIGDAPLHPGRSYAVISESPVTPAGGGGSAEAPAYADLVGPVCFAAGSLIATPDGPRPVETLQPGDSVLTRDHGAQPILWTGARRLSWPEILAGPRLRPILLAPGALGPGRPLRPLRLSPQHRVLLDLGGATGEVLVAVKHLAGRPGIRRDDRLRPLCYHHLLFDRHQIVQADGLACESLLPGPIALQLLGPRAAAEVLALVGDPAAYPPARPILRGGAFRRLAGAHATIAPA